MNPLRTQREETVFRAVGLLDGLLQTQLFCAELSVAWVGPGRWWGWQGPLVRPLLIMSPRTTPKQGLMPISTRRGSWGCDCGDDVIHFIPGLRGAAEPVGPSAPSPCAPTAAGRLGCCCRTQTCI